MKSTPFGILSLTAALFVVVALASWMGDMHGQETVGQSTQTSGGLDFSEPPGTAIPLIPGPQSENELPARGGQLESVLNEVPSPAQANPVPELPICLLYTSPSPRDLSTSRMPSSA